MEITKTAKNIWRGQIKALDRVLDHFVCCDGVYRTNPDAYDQIMETIEPVMAPVLQDSFRLLRDTTDYFTAPASTKYHGAWQSGLLVHSMLVAKDLLNISINMDLPWNRVHSPFIVGMLHDACKINRYKKMPDGSYTYDDSLFPYPGHGERSVAMLDRLGVQCTEEEKFCIRFHMGAYETNEWDYYDKAIKLYPTVLWTHTADMYASKVDGV